MPFSTPPDYVSGLPNSVQQAWMKAFNSAYAYAKKNGMDDPDGYAYAVANSVANKRGYRRKNGKWVKQSTDHDDTLPETLTINTPHYQVPGATTYQLVTFHARLHRMMNDDEDDERIDKMHGLVVDILRNRGVSHNDEAS